MSATEHLIGTIRITGITRRGVVYETSDASLADAVWAVINGDAIIVSKSGILFEERNVGDLR